MSQNKPRKFKTRKKMLFYALYLNQVRVKRNESPAFLDKAVLGTTRGMLSEWTEKN